MSITLTCPSCSTSLVFPDNEQERRKLQCNKCQHKFYFSKADGVLSDNADTENSPPTKSSQSSSRNTLIGQTLGGCTVEKKIGQGGMGAVFLGRHLALNRPVAIKVLPPSFAKANRKHVERFIREARAAGKLQHPNIVAVHDVGEEKGLHYIIMEFVDGQDLNQQLKASGAMAETDALIVTQQIAYALETAWQHHIVHRDIKPHNIMIAEDGTAKLMDLGLAKSVEDDHSVTQSGVAMGTPHYISPEQALDAVSAEHRSDIYSLGCSLFHMVCGHVPYKGTSMFQLMKRHESDPIPDPRESAPQLSKSTAALIMKMMGKKPEDRHQSATELAEDIDIILNGGTVPYGVAGKKKTAMKATPAVLRRKTTQRHKPIPPEPRPTPEPVPEPAEILAPEPVAADADAVEDPKQKSPLPMIVGIVLFLAAIGIYFATRPATPTPPTEPGTPAPAPAASEKWQVALQVAQKAYDENQFATSLKQYDLALLAMTKSGDTDAAIQDATRADRAFVKFIIDRAALAPPQQFVATKAKLKSVNPDYTGAGSFQAKGTMLRHLTIERGKLRDLRPLKGLPLTFLNLNHNQIVDLTPLKGMPLSELSLANNRVVDLKPLNAMPLKILRLNQNHVADLAPLVSLPLTQLFVDDNRLYSLAPLAGLRLNILYLRRNQITDLTPLQKMPLRELRLTDNPLRNLAPLRGIKLTSLSIDGANIADLRSLDNMPLRGLWFTLSKVKQGKELVREMKSLTELGLTERRSMSPAAFWKKYDPKAQKTPTPVALPANATVKEKLHTALKAVNPGYSGRARLIKQNGSIVQADFTGHNLVNLAPLKGLKLTFLRLNGCPIRDLSPLKGMPLRSLYLDKCTAITSLEPLRGMPLTTLTLAGTNISSLTPLAKLPLTSLDLRNCTRLRDISPLKGVKLRRLYLHGCTQLTNIAALRGMPLGRLTISDCPKLTDIRLLKKLKIQELILSPHAIKKGLPGIRANKFLRTIGIHWPSGYTPAKFWQKFDAGEFKKKK